MATIAKLDDGTVQITFVIPWKSAKSSQEAVIEELIKEVEIPGFRKGNAPKEKAREKLSQGVIIEKTLAKILPKLLGDAIDEHKIKPIIYPRFELIKANDSEDWEVKAITCEMPEIDLGNYKDVVSGALRSASLVKPGEAEKDKVQKEQEVIKALLQSVKVKIPKILIEEEVNARLSSLLSRIEKLGLNLESYLSSIGKTPEGLRSEYESQAQSSITLELALNKIALDMNIKVKDSQIDEAIKTSAASDTDLAKRLETPEQRNIIRSVLARRMVIDSLMAL